MAVPAACRGPDPETTATVPSHPAAWTGRVSTQTGGGVYRHNFVNLILTGFILLVPDVVIFWLSSFVILYESTNPDAEPT